MSWQLTIKMKLGKLTLDLELAGEDETIAIIGPNGSGKSTVLRTIAGAYQPTSGVISIGERVIFDSGQGINLQPESRNVGYVPQGYGLFNHLRVIDNVAFGLTTRQPKLKKSDARRRASELLHSLDCGGLEHRWPATLSGGEQQRVALARALMLAPKLLLLDEPLSALDALARRSLRTYLAAHLVGRGHPTLIVTHDARDVFALCDRVIALEDGRVVQQGSPKTVADNPSTDFIQEFFHLDIRTGIQKGETLTDS